MEHLITLLGVYAGTAVVCAISGVVPFVNSEAFLLVVSAAARPAQVPALALAAALGQMGGKSVLYLAGRGALRLPLPARFGAPGRWSHLVAGRRTDALVLASAFAGVPPFYAVSVGAGVLGWSFPRFLAAGTCGRLLRFALLMALPQLLKEVWR